jgi:hypothetical protein
MLKEKITVGEAVNLINESILNFNDGLSSETVNKIIYSINGEIQVRDYLLGMPNTFPMDTCKAFLTYISESVDGAERYSVDTVLSAYFYETNDMEIATHYLFTAIDTKSDYSLAQLIKRVIEAGWPTDSFAQMRNEMHPKVVELIEEMSEELI